MGPPLARRSFRVNRDATAPAFCSEEKDDLREDGREAGGLVIGAGWGVGVLDPPRAVGVDGELREPGFEADVAEDGGGMVLEGDMDEMDGEGLPPLLEVDIALLAPPFKTVV